METDLQLKFNRCATCNDPLSHESLPDENILEILKLQKSLFRKRYRFIFLCNFCNYAIKAAFKEERLKRKLSETL